MVSECSGMAGNGQASTRLSSGNGAAGRRRQSMSKPAISYINNVKANQYGMKMKENGMYRYQ